MIAGLIIKATGSWYDVKLSDNRRIACRLPGKFRLSDDDFLNPAAVGDHVDVVLQGDNTGVIEHIRERRNQLMRKATHGRRGIQVIAANVDRVAIIQSLREPVLKTGFTDRILAGCESCEIPAMIVINKMDLMKDKKDAELVDELKSLYMDLGYSFHTASVFDHSSISQLKSHLEGSVSVFTGPSGSGKTSLLNMLSPGLQLKTREISHFSNKGRHTTTFAQLIELGGSTYIADTPGIREFGPAGILPVDVSSCFPEMKSLRDMCRFGNCTHRHEPSCAVKKALEENQIAASRYRSYLNIIEGSEL